MKNIIITILLLFGLHPEGSSDDKPVDRSVNTYWISKDYTDRVKSKDDCARNYGIILCFKEKDYYLYSGYISQKGDSICPDLNGGGVLWKGSWRKDGDVVFTKSKVKISEYTELLIDPEKYPDYEYISNYLLRGNELMSTDSSGYVPLNRAIRQDCRYLFDL